MSAVILEYNIDELTSEAKTAAYESYINNSSYPWNEMDYHSFISRAQQERFVFTVTGRLIRK